MDYDDKDFQSQNLRLDCEGNNTVRPFALPKFDFDDILQGHLRFDNLVETGVFLGIESQEENCWIEDFSRGSSGIEFSPRAAESCSISRCNNAWFEATSSESVEMLLKSVGQEEFIPGKTILGSDMNDESGNLTMKMVPILNQDDSTLLKADIVDVSDICPRGLLLGDFPRSVEDVGPEPMQIDHNLQTGDGESTVHQSQINLDPSTDGEKFVYSAIKGNLLHKSKCSDMSQINDDLSVHDFPARSTEDTSGNRMQATNFLVVDNLMSSCCIKKADKLHNDNYDVREKDAFLSNQSLFGDRALQGKVVASCIHNAKNPVGVVPAVDSILEGNVVEFSKEMEEPSPTMLKDESDQDESKKCEVLDFHNDNVCADYYENDRGNDVVVSLESPSNAGNCPSLERNMDFDAQYNHGSSIDKGDLNFMESGYQLGTENLPSNSKAYMMSVEEDYCNILNCGNPGSAVSDMAEGSHSILACSSSGFLGRKHEIEKFKRHCNSSEICKQELIYGVHSPSSSLGDNRVTEQNVVSKQTSVHNYNQEDSGIKSEAELPNDVNNVECVGVRLISKGCGHQMGTEALTRNSEASLMSMKYCEVLNSGNDESDVSHVVDGPHLIGKKSVNLLESNDQVSNEILASKSEASLISVEYSKVLNSENAESAASHVVPGLHSILACPSPDFIDRKQELEKFKDPQKTFKVCENESFSGVHSTSSTESDISVRGKNILSGQSSVHNYNQGDSGPKSEAELLINANSVKCQSAGLIATKHASPHNNSDVDTGIKSEEDLLIDANNVEREGTGLIVTDEMLVSSSMGKSCPIKGSGVVLEDRFQFAPQDGVVNDDVIESKFNENLSSPVIEPSNFGKIEENVTSMSVETNSSTLNDYSENINVLHVISSGQKHTSNAAERLDNEDELSKINGELSEGLGECPLPCDSVLKDNNLETRLRINLEHTVENHEEASFGISEQFPNQGIDEKDSGIYVDQTRYAPGEGNCEQIDVLVTSGEAFNALEGSASTACFLEGDAKSTLNDGGNLFEGSEKLDCGSPTTIISGANNQHLDESQKSVSLSAECLLETDNKSAVHEGGSGCEGSEKIDAKTTLNDGGNVIEGSDKSISVSCVGQRVDVLQEDFKRPVDVNLGASAVNRENTEETSPVLKGIDRKKDNRSFSFKITPLPASPKKGSSDQAGQVLEKFTPKVVDGSYSSPLGQLDPKLDQKTADISLTSFPSISSVGSKSFDRKLKQASAKSPGKEVAKKAKLSKAVSPMRSSQRGDESCILPSSSAASQHQQPDKMLHCGNVEWVGTKPVGTLSTDPSNLPDLNASASTPVFFHQPFTDMQQLQLRAQILVYGSLISGSAPDEACMIAAFGSSDIGRSSWEKAWRACVERAHNKKLPSNNQETPSPSCTVGRSYSLESSNHGAESRILSSPLVRTSNRGSPSPIVNSMMAISSPHWNICTPSSDSLQPSNSFPRGAVLDYHQSLSPLPTYQSPSLQSFIGHTSWLPPGPFPVPWISSPQVSSVNAGARFSAFPTTDSVRLAPLIESSLPRSSALNPVPHNVTASSGPLGNAKITPTPLDNSDLKSRKRKKIPIFAELSHIASPSASIVSTSPAPKTDSYKFTTAVSSSLIPINIKTGNHNVLSEETLSNVKNAKVQAEDASVNAAASVCHCQEVWNQIGKQKNSGLISDLEATLTSAAVAVAASASIAKAAAAAATIASNIALQSKLLADEALHASGNHSQNSGISRLDETSVIGAAREAARKRVEAASAASKQAEIFVALVKSAELASEAVSQAGKVVTMGDPMALKQLIEAGPEGFWKLSETSSGTDLKSNDLIGSKLNAANVEKGSDNFAKCSDVVVPRMEFPSRSHTKSFNDDGDLAGQEDSNSAQTVGVAPESEFLPISASINVSNQYGQAIDTVNDTLEEGGIKMGSLLEVYKDSHGYKPAWYMANALSLEDGKVHACYTALTSDDGVGMLKEWVTVEGEGEKAPRVRSARRIFCPKKGKRQRADIEKCTYYVGDRVDAWLRTCWCEGVITETQKNDENAYTVSFPAVGETLLVKAWHLRSTLIWNDGEWVECSTPRQTLSSSHEVDAPQEKRPRLTSPNVKAAEEKAEQSTTLPPKADFKFTRGKVGHAGSQKDGPRVIYGVPPKMKKKRKFMEVSKHYVGGEKSKIAEKEGDSGTLLLGRQNLSGFGNTKTGPGSSSFVFSSSKKLLNPKPDHKVKQPGLSNAKLGRIEEDRSFAGDSGKTTFEVSEPRRSNRRIQPTSRLLEGLQSSMVVSKISSHDRAQKKAEQKHIWRN